MRALDAAATARSDSAATERRLQVAPPSPVVATVPLAPTAQAMPPSTAATPNSVGEEDRPVLITQAPPDLRRIVPPSPTAQTVVPAAATASSRDVAPSWKRNQLAPPSSVRRTTGE